MTTTPTSRGFIPLPAGDPGDSDPPGEEASVPVSGSEGSPVVVSVVPGSEPPVVEVAVGVGVTVPRVIRGSSAANVSRPFQIATPSRRSSAAGEIETTPYAAGKETNSVVSASSTAPEIASPTRSPSPEASAKFVHSKAYRTTPVSVTSVAVVTETFRIVISRPVAFSAARAVRFIRVANRDSNAERFARMSSRRDSNASVVLESSKFTR